MAVAHSADSTGGTGSTNGVIGFLNLGTASATNNSITIGASDTKCIILICWSNSVVSTGGWTVTLGATSPQTATLISGSYFHQTATDDSSLIAFEVNNPTSGSRAVNLANSNFTPTTTPVYMAAMSFTGSDTTSASVAFGSSTNTAGNPATTGNSASSIPSTDMIVGWFADPFQGFNNTVSASTATSVTFVDVNQSQINNALLSRATGGNAVTTMTATQSASDSYAAIGIWVKVAASAAVDIGGRSGIFRVQRGPGWRWRAPPRGYKRRRGILLKAA